MQITGLMHGAPLLRHVDFPTTEVLGPDATEDEIAALIKRHGQVFVKPLFGGVGKKGKSGLIGRAKDLRTALAEKAPVLRRAPARQRSCQGQRRDLRRRRAGRARDLLRDHRRHALPCAIGAAAEIDDHLNRGRNMDTRTPEAQCAHVL
jgi:hypothetical protein